MQTEVEHAPQPLIIVTLQADILLDPHDTRIGQGCLVEVIEAVDDAHQWHNMKIDLADKSLVCSLIDVYDFPIVSLECFHCLVCIMRVLQDPGCRCRGSSLFIKGGTDFLLNVMVRSQRRGDLLVGHRVGRCKLAVFDRGRAGTGEGNVSIEQRRASLHAHNSRST